MRLKKVAIVGKPNVGKSQLFNRIVQEKHSVVLENPGITRDRVSLVASWLKYKFFITDSGGYADELGTIDFQSDINQQTKEAIAEADLIVFVVSKKDGINKEDMDVANLIKKYQKPVILVLNKCDAVKEDAQSYAHYNLGFGDGLSISAEHGINVGELLNEIVSKLNLHEDTFEHEKSETRFAIIGKPNVGKSSLCNALLQEERLIVSPIAGTTRDAIDISFSYQGSIYTLIDTPGIKKGKTLNNNKAEALSILRAKQSLKRANVICFVIDISEGVKEIDERIGGLAFEANIPTIIIANKWDLIDYKSDIQTHVLEKEIRQKMPYLSWAPIVFVSAKDRLKIPNIFKTLEKVKKESSIQISQIELKNFLVRVSALITPPKVANHRVNLFNIKQVKSQIPTFIINCNNIDYLHFSYERMLENKLRDCFNLRCTPIKVFYRSKK